MGFRLRTSEKTKDIFEELTNQTHLKPFALAKIAISLSLKEYEKDIDFDDDQNGLELHRQTVTGDKDILFKSIIENIENKQLTEDEFYPDFAKKHIDRGAVIFINKLRYSGNYERFIKNILSGEDSI